jgi:hypothetical protein
MDGDPAVEPELDSFSLTLPLPYRVAIAIVLGSYFWYMVCLSCVLINAQEYGHGV